MLADGHPPRDPLHHGEAVSLILYTAPSPCADPDAIDLGTPGGAWLAPSFAAITDLRQRRHAADRMRHESFRTGLMRLQAWEQFEAAYRRELRLSAWSADGFSHVEPFVSLLLRSRVVICSGDAEVTHPGNVRREDPSRSPRAVVAAVLVELGAEWRGELP